MSAPAGTRSYCTECGSVLLAGDQFCGECGHSQPPLPAAAAPVVWVEAPASFGQRLAARLIDGAVLAVPTVVLWVALLGSLAAFEEPDTALAGLLLGSLVVLAGGFVCSLLYLQLCETTGGRTVGRAAMGIRVISLRGGRDDRLTHGQALGRRIVENLGECVFGLAALSMLWDPQRRTWGDRASGTAVIRSRSGGGPRVGLLAGAGALLVSALGMVALIALSSVAASDSPSSVPVDAAPFPVTGSEPSAPTQAEPVDPARSVPVASTVTVPDQAPDGIDARGDATSYAAGNLLDGDPTTTWRMEGDATGQDLVIGLEHRRAVTSVGLINGYAKTDPSSGADRYAQERVILQVTWVIDGASYVQRFTRTRSLQLLDIPGGVSSDTVQLRLDVVSAPGDPDFDYTAISELVVKGQ